MPRLARRVMAIWSGFWWAPTIWLVLTPGAGSGMQTTFFDIAETLSWMRALPRMEAHVLDGGHKLLETHAAAAVPLILDFIGRTQRESGVTPA
jgi:hypothetical protein